MEKTIEKTDEREVDHRSPYHRFGPQIERLQRSAEQGEQEFKEAMTILQSMKSEVNDNLAKNSQPFCAIRPSGS